VASDGLTGFGRLRTFLSINSPPASLSAARLITLRSKLLDRCWQTTCVAVFCRESQRPRPSHFRRKVITIGSTRASVRHFGGKCLFDDQGRHLRVPLRGVAIDLVSPSRDYRQQRPAGPTATKTLSAAHAWMVKAPRALDALASQKRSPACRLSIQYPAVLHHRLQPDNRWWIVA